jgi:hypothetical protein
MADYPHQVHVLWGKHVEPGDRPRTFSFATEAELNAFRSGMAEAVGWMSYRIVDDPDFVVTEENMEDLPGEEFAG